MAREQRTTIYICSHCGYAPGNRRSWCNAGCGSDYNDMEPTEVLLLPQTPEQQEELVERVARALSPTSLHDAPQAVIRPYVRVNMGRARAALRAAGLLPEEEHAPDEHLTPEVRQGIKRASEELGRLPDRDS